MSSSTSTLHHPVAVPPPPGQMTEIAPGVLWLRLPLPYALDHVNLFLFEDDGGWALFDTGIGDDTSRALWMTALSGPLGGKPITRLLVSHFHPDHVGLAGWFHDRFAPRFFMPQAEYLYSRMMSGSQDARSRAFQGTFYRQCGLDTERVDQLINRGLSYLTRTTGLPPSFERLIGGQTVRIGGRDWRVLTGGGHSPEQAVLWCEAERLFFSADQVLARISPNVAVFAVEPEADPLGLFVQSLAEIRAAVPENALVLPGHNLPFVGLHRRIDELTEHHEQRCALVVEACRAAPKTCAEVVPLIFRRALDPHQLSFAVGETLAHLNRLIREGRMLAEMQDGVLSYRAA